MNFFRLRNTMYDVDYGRVSISGGCGETLSMFPEVEAHTEDERLDYPMRELHLYHNNGFDTGVMYPYELKGKKFVWTSKDNDRGEEAGFLYVQEHEDVTSGVIEIADINIATIRIRWTGTADVDWDEEFGRDVPFETEFEDDVQYSVMMEYPRMILDENTAVEVLNLDELFAENQRCLDLYHSGNKGALDKYSLTLRFRLFYKNIPYDGEAVFRESNAAKETHLPENCPLKLRVRWAYRSVHKGKFHFNFAVDD